MMPGLTHVIFDEAGDTGFQPGSSRHLVGVAVLGLTLHELRRIALAVRKDARKARIRLPELKARLVPTWLVYEGLQHALRWEWRAIAVILDKKSQGRLPADLEGLYRGLTACVVLKCLKQSSALHFIADKRYTRAEQRDHLVDAISNAVAVAGLNAVLTIEQVPSEQRQELLLADYLAWAVFRKYERGDETAYRLIASRLVEEDMLDWRQLLETI